MRAPGDPREELADRLRAARYERLTQPAEPDAVDPSVSDAQAIAILRMALVDLPARYPIDAADLAHCLGVVLAAARQSFFQVSDVSDRQMQAVLPLTSHLSGMAESMIVLADSAR